MRPAHRLIAAALAAAAALAPARALEPMSSASNNLERGVANAGGTRSVSASNALIGSFGEEVMLTTAASAANRLGAGWSHLHAYPAAVTGLSGVVSTTALTLSWATPGYDGTLGAVQSGSVYYLRVASYTVPDSFTVAQAAAISTGAATLTPGHLVGSVEGGLIANTTFFAQLWLRDAAGGLSAPFRSTFTTLANAPTPGVSQFLLIQGSTVSVAWAAHPPSPDSATSFGYLVEASSDDFATAPVLSSGTYASAASTLTLQGLDLSNTYYFRVASRNHQGALNYTTLSRLVFTSTGSSALLDLGAIDMSVAQSTVSTSSMVVVNTGNWPMTFAIEADTATAGSSWRLGDAIGPDQPVLQGLWNSGAIPPAPGAFSTVISSAPRASGGGGGDYAGDQNGFQVPAGGSRTLWFRFQIPSSTSENGEQQIRVVATPSYP